MLDSVLILLWGGAVERKAAACGAVVCARTQMLATERKRGRLSNFVGWAEGRRTFHALGVDAMCKCCVCFDIAERERERETRTRGARLASRRISA